MTEQIVKDNGFDSLEELNRLICNINLASPKLFHEFKKWQNQDGTKKGLLSVIEASKELR